MKTEDLKNRRVLVVGLGISGFSVARFLVRHGVAFDAADECDEPTAETHRQQLDSLMLGSEAPRLHVVFDAQVFCEYDVLILSPGIARTHRAVHAALLQGVIVIGDIELFADVVDVPVIAVTGSNGKSTVVSWLASALNHAQIKAIACGNIGQPALDSLLLDADVYVLELSSYQLESTDSLHALVATVLNVSDDHLDRYDDIEHYAQVKRRLLGMSTHVVANREDTRTWPSDCEAKNCEFFSTNTERSGNARWHRQQNGDAKFLCEADCVLLDESKLRLPGAHNVANALAVLALAAPMGVSFDKLCKGLIEYSGLPHRTQYVGENKGVRWYNDSKGTNVDACQKAILAMPGPVLLIAGGMSKGADFSVLNDTLKRCVKLLILLGCDKHKMACQMQGAHKIVMVNSLEEAVGLAWKNAVSGDAVLLSPACSSFDMFNNFEDRGNKFVAAVQEVLAA